MLPPAVTLGWVPTRYRVRPAPRESGAHPATIGTGPRPARAGRPPGPGRRRSRSRRGARGGRPWRADRVARSMPRRSGRPARRCPGTPSATSGKRGRSSAVSGSVAGSGASFASVRPIDAGRWAWATAPMSGRAPWMARWIARSEVGPSPLRRDRLALRVAHPDHHQVVALELVLAPSGRRHQQPIDVQAYGQVALAGGDQAARTEAATGADDRVGGGLERGVAHGPIVRPRRAAPALVSDRFASRAGRRQRPSGGAIHPARSRVGRDLDRDPAGARTRPRSRLPARSRRVRCTMDIRR